MKKLSFILAMTVFVVAIFTSCNSKTEDNSMSNISQSTTLSTLPQESTLSQESTETDSGGGDIVSGKYRQRYYNIPYEFVILVDREVFREWNEEIHEISLNETNVMAMVSFIQEFNISREDFEKANLVMAKGFVEIGENPMLSPKDYENQQSYEIYNADIVFSFDNDLINEYYLTPEWPFCSEGEYEYALEHGTYQTQTTDWVDVAQMEADIIAKYGSVD